MHRKGDAGRATLQRSLPPEKGSAGASPYQKSLMIRVKSAFLAVNKSEWVIFCKVLPYNRM